MSRLESLCHVPERNPAGVLLWSQRFCRWAWEKSHLSKDTERMREKTNIVDDSQIWTWIPSGLRPLAGVMATFHWAEGFPSVQGPWEVHLRPSELDIRESTKEKQTQQYPITFWSPSSSQNGRYWRDPRLPCGIKTDSRVLSTLGPQLLPPCLVHWAPNHWLFSPSSPNWYVLFPLLGRFLPKLFPSYPCSLSSFHLSSDFIPWR